MEEILASIRRIIADDDGKSPPPPADPMPPRPAVPPPRPVVTAVPPPRPAPPPPPVAPVEPAMRQDEIDAMLADLNKATVSVPEKPASDVLDLTESMAAAPPPRTDGFRTIDAQSDIVFEDSPDESLPAMAAPRAEPVAEERPLISSVTSAAVDSAFNSLAHTVLVQNARTLEDLVREMLRPLLKTWLDDNLPSLVERLVRAEIERVSRGRG